MAREPRERRVIEDAGEKIGNARKDLRGALTRADLDGMTEAERAALVTKDRVWPKPDWEALVAAGMDPTCAALLKIGRDRIAAKPSVLRGSTFVEASDGYVSALGRVRALAEACRTREDASRLQERLLAELGWGRGVVAPAVKQELFSIFKGRASPLQFTGGDLGKARKMVEEGFPGQPVEAWRRGLAVEPHKGGFLLFRGNQIQPGSPFPDEASAWDAARARFDAAAEERGAARAAEAQAERALPERPHLERLERTGPDLRDGRDVSPEDFLAEFGFRAVEFGNWLPDGERQQVLNLGYDALHDLARAIGWDPRELSLGGTLAVAFGARGTGRAAAHYEPDRTVLNMTRLRGAGAVAHEWCHAFDHWLGRQGGDEIEDGEPRFASGYRKHVRSRLKALSRLPDGLAQAVDTLVGAMRQRSMTPEEALGAARTSLEDARRKLTEAERVIAADAARTDGHGMGKADAKKWAEWRANCGRLVAALETRIGALEAGAAVPLAQGQTDFLREALAISGGPGYWSRPTELLSRAFEATVHDRLTAAGERSDYLVHGVEEGRFACSNFKGDPYPAGQERRLIAERLMEVVDLARPLVPEPANAEATVPAR